MKIALAVGIIANMLVIVGAFCAYRDSFLTPKQMLAKGYTHGLPFIAHGGMWGDLLFVSPLIALIVSRYGQQWSVNQVIYIALLSLVASGLMHLMYAKGTLPEAHAHEGKPTPAGCVHFVYMAGAFTILGLFYFCTPHISQGFLIMASVLLGIHILIGNHMVLGAIDPIWYGGKPLQSIQGWSTVASVWILLAWRCYAI